MNTTMVLDATNFVDQEMTSLDTILVIRMAIKLAWKAGWDQTATEVCNTHVLFLVHPPLPNSRGQRGYLFRPTKHLLRRSGFVRT